MDELKMTGNCLRGSRGICVFDGAWEESEHWRLMKEMFSHVSRLGLTMIEYDAELIDRSSLCPRLLDV